MSALSPLDVGRGESVSETGDPPLVREVYVGTPTLVDQSPAPLASPPVKRARTKKSHRSGELSRAPATQSNSQGTVESNEHAGRPVRAGRAPVANSLTSDGPPLREATLEYWQQLTEDERMGSHKVIDSYYHHLLEDFRNNANDAVQGYATYEKRNKQWRLALICLTGGLALINVAATSFPDKWGSSVRAILSFCAAIYAVILALFTNIESYLHYNEKKTATRESREMYLDAYREFEMLRLRYVYPYGCDAHACYNFNALYQRLVAKDVELRRKIMQVSTTRTGAAKE